MEVPILNPGISYFQIKVILLDSSLLLVSSPSRLHRFLELGVFSQFSMSLSIFLSNEFGFTD